MAKSEAAHFRSISCETTNCPFPMNPLPSTSDPANTHSHRDPVAPQPSFWRKLGGGSLSISIFVHALLLIIGVIWVFQVIPEKVPEVDFMPKGGGGGQPGAKSDVNMKKRATMTTANAPRVAAKDVVSNFTLPEPDPASSMSSVGALGSSGMSGGLGGSGSGGGRGSGTGTGFGSGTGPGMGGGGGTMNPFGMTNPNANSMVGTFYDLKQTKDRKPTDMTDDGMREFVKDFVKRGLKDSMIDKYYRAPQKLYQTKISMPNMSADAAPTAFNCQNEVQPKRWLVVYRGMVTPPKTARYRFVGAGDDLLVVRLNGRYVFDYGYTMGTNGIHLYRKFPELNGTTENKDYEKEFRSSGPMRIPISFYTYPETPLWNQDIGGVAVGPEFEARAGTSYPIEILIGEIPGGWFCASLLLEEVGATYQKSATGAPILPLFRLDSSLPDRNTPGERPPFDPAGPSWKLIPGTGKLDL